MRSWQQCYERGLVHSAKWYARRSDQLMLNTIGDTRVHRAAEQAAAIAGEDLDDDAPSDAATDVLSPAESSHFAFARSLFDLKEFDRCAHALRNCQSNKSVFLRIYAKYLVSQRFSFAPSNFINLCTPQAGERRKEDARADAESK
jgi:anaphase-promoting complex subunit 8